MILRKNLCLLRKTHNEEKKIIHPFMRDLKLFYLREWRKTYIFCYSFYREFKIIKELFFQNPADNFHCLFGVELSF